MKRVGLFAAGIALAIGPWWGISYAAHIGVLSDWAVLASVVTALVMFAIGIVALLEAADEW